MRSPGPRSRLRSSNDCRVGQRQEPSFADQPLVDPAETAGEGRVDGHAEGDRLAVHRAPSGDDEIGVRDQALCVHGPLGHDERGQPESADHRPLLVGAREHDRLDGLVAAEPLEHGCEERVPVPVVERDLGRRPHHDEDARGVEAVDGVGRRLEVGEVVLLLQPLVAEQLRRPRAESRQPLGRDRLRHDHPRGRAAAQLMLQPGVLVVEGCRARDPEPPRGQRQLVRPMRQRDVESAPLREAVERAEPSEERTRLAEPPRAAVPGAHHLVRDAVQLEQLERLRVLARRHLDLVALSLEQADQGPEEGDVRRVRDVDPDSHRNDSIRCAYGHAAAGGVLRRRRAEELLAGG